MSDLDMLPEWPSYRYMTTSPMTGSVEFAAMTTDATVMVYPHKFLQEAKEFVEEKRRKEFVMHICKCHYCRQSYPASLELTYECPMCGAHEFDITRTIDNEEFTRRTNG